MELAAGRHPTGGDTPSWDFDVAGWRRRMQQSDIADELFLPLENGDWIDRRFRLIPGERAEARTRITGVRFLSADPQRENLEPERAVQNDFHRLLESLIKLRATAGCERLCLSRETFRTSPRRDVPRLRFGLVDGDPKLAEDRAAARRCHQQVCRAVRRTGFVIADPKTRFDPDTGMLGLLSWADQLRLRRRRLWWPWLLLLPLWLMVPDCEDHAGFFGAPIRTQSFLLLVDRSSSMSSHFAALQAEAGRVLRSLQRDGGCQADVISYHAGAESALGAITPLDEATVTRLQSFLRDLQSGGGTDLKAGIDLAAKEITAQGKPTTLIVLTDAQDGSIAGMVGSRDELLAAFQSVEIHGYGLTPRFFVQEGVATGAPTDLRPQDDNERLFAELMEMLGGHFGPDPQTSR